MSTFDKFGFLALTVALPVLVTIGGLMHPHTLAGSVARFVFSLHA